MRPPAIPKHHTATTGNGKNLARAHWLSTFLLSAAFLSTLIAIAVKSESNWPEALLLVLTAVSTVTALARQLPMQNVLTAALIIAFIGGAAHALGVITGIPFGPFTFGFQIGAQLFGTLPWTIPLLWVAVILNSRGVARLILRPWRKTRTYGFRLIGLTVLLVILFNLALDPFATRVKHYWIWMPTKFPLTWQGAPLTNFTGWGIVSLLILAFITPSLINKQLSKQSRPDYHPLAVWIGATLLFAIAAALRGTWVVVGVDVVTIIIAAIFAIRGGRW